MKWWRETRVKGHPARTLLVRTGIVLAVVSGVYLLAGITGLAPLGVETLAWNNIRIVAGLTIAGCLLAAVGYGDH